MFLKFNLVAPPSGGTSPSENGESIFVDLAKVSTVMYDKTEKALEFYVLNTLYLSITDEGQQSQAIDVLLEQGFIKGKLVELHSVLGDEIDCERFDDVDYCDYYLNLKTYANFFVLDENRSENISRITFDSSINMRRGVGRYIYEVSCDAIDRLYTKEFSAMLTLD